MAYHALGVCYDFALILCLLYTEPPAPENITIAERNTTSLKICWKRFTLVELNGLGNYTITYRPGGSREAETTVSVPWTVNCTMIHNLTPGVEYEITILVSLSTKTSSKCNLHAVVKELIEINLIIVPARTSAVTTSVPDIASNNTPIIIIIVVVLVAFLVIAIFLALVCIYAIWRKRRSDKVKLENSKRYTKLYQ